MKALQKRGEHQCSIFLSWMPAKILQRSLSCYHYELRANEGRRQGCSTALPRLRTIDKKDDPTPRRWRGSELINKLLFGVLKQTHAETENTQP